LVPHATRPLRGTMDTISLPFILVLGLLIGAIVGVYRAATVSSVAGGALVGMIAALGIWAVAALI
jgi:hypothetical protein